MCGAALGVALGPRSRPAARTTPRPTEAKAHASRVHSWRVSSDERRIARSLAPQRGQATIGPDLGGEVVTRAVAKAHARVLTSRTLSSLGAWRESRSIVWKSAGPECPAAA